MIHLFKTIWWSFWSIALYAVPYVQHPFRLLFRKTPGLPAIEKNATTSKFTYHDNSQLIIQYQTGLGTIGFGAAGQVYAIDDQIVLKAYRIYQPPSDRARPSLLWEYASEAIFHSGMLKDEK